MKFIIVATSAWDANEVLEKYPCLNNYNPVFVITNQEKLLGITINSLEQYIQLQHDIDEPLILIERFFKDGTHRIEIYDDYRE